MEKRNDKVRQLVGKMDRRIKVYSLIYQRDQFGGTKFVRFLDGNLWAHVVSEPTVLEGVVDSGKTTATDRISIYVRKVKNIPVTEKKVIEYNGKIFNVISVSEYNTGNQSDRVLHCIIERKM
jgi:SPP1 family predicted phage head-tail adaptor